MPRIKIDSTLTLHYDDHCFADPWLNSETIVLIHGNGDSSDAWYAWIPELTGRFRVIRPDLRGFGKSTIPAPGYEWSPQAHAADLHSLLTSIGIAKAHVIGAKYGGTVAAQFAADYPDMVLTLGLIGPLIKGANTGSTMEVSTLGKVLDSSGHTGFAVDSQRQRMGTDASAEQVAWWNNQMGQGDQRVAEEIIRAASKIDLTPILSKIAAPTLVITADKSATQGLEWVLEWQRQLKDSELSVLACDGYHIAAVRPHECAYQVRSFIQRRSARIALGHQNSREVNSAQE